MISFGRRGRHHSSSADEGPSPSKTSPAALTVARSGLTTRTRCSCFNKASAALGSCCGTLSSDGRGMMARCRSLKDRCGSSSCVSVCTKAYLIIINFIFLLTGWFLFGLGVWIYVYRDTFVYSVLLRDNPTRPLIVLDHLSLLLIVIGGFVVVISFLGCCGACTESVCFLGFYALLLIAAIVAQVCAVSLATGFRQKLLAGLEASLLYQLKHEYNITNKTGTDEYRIMTAWDTLQIKLNCCGASSPIDYHTSSWYNHSHYSDGGFVPMSCCLPTPAALQGADTNSVEQGRTGGGTGLHGSSSAAAGDRRTLSSSKLPSGSFSSSSGLMTSSLGEHSGQRAHNTAAHECQIDAMALVYGEDPAKRHHLRVQGCHPALVDWLSRYEYIISILFFVIVLQIVDFVYACILMSWVRKTLADYSWCENDDFQ